MPASIYNGTVFAESRFIMSEKKSMKQKRFSLFDMTLCALFAAVICVLSPISIQIGPIPVSLGLLGVLPVSSTHLRAHETGRNLVCRLLLEKKKYGNRRICLAYTYTSPRTKKQSRSTSYADKHTHRPLSQHTKTTKY